MAVVLTLVQTKQIRINIHKRNNTKNAVQTTQNTVNTSTLITKPRTRYKTHTYAHPHTTKQFKTTTVQVKTTTVQEYPNEIVTIQPSTLSTSSP